MFEGVRGCLDFMLNLESSVVSDRRNCRCVLSIAGVLDCLWFIKVCSKGDQKAGDLTLRVYMYEGTLRYLYYQLN